MTDGAVEMRGITKSFGGTRVLDEVDFTLGAGEIHALAGGNGAGKSTLMKILVGVYQRDAGSYRVLGEDARFGSIHDAIAAGVGMVFQEFSLIPQMSVAQNIFLDREPRGRAGLIDDRRMVREARDILETMSVDLDPRRNIEDLPTAYWQLTEIAKALSQDARVLIMDEPTAALAKSETQDLFALLRRLQDQGISIIYISHRMEEIFQICDRLTVLRDGEVAMTGDLVETSMEDIIGAIVGKRLEDSMAWEEREVGDEVVLHVSGLTAGERLSDVDLALRKGEVLGLAGLMGSGRTELARALFGIDGHDAGSIELYGEPARIGSPESAIKQGIALIPEDRRVQGLVLDHDVEDNLVLPFLERITRRGFIDDGAGRRQAEHAVERFSIKVRSLGQSIRQLSGGNQQKVVIGKWLGTDPRILIMDEPTAGVDIGTKVEIVRMIRAFADDGGSVIMISSELPELLAVSDRILILRDGHVETEIDRRAIEREEDLHHAVQGSAA